MNVIFSRVWRFQVLFLSPILHFSTKELSHSLNMYYNLCSQDHLPRRSNYANNFNHLRFIYHTVYNHFNQSHNFSIDWNTRDRFIPNQGDIKRGKTSLLGDKFLFPHAIPATIMHSSLDGSPPGAGHTKP